MIDYIQGTIEQLDPASLIIEASGIGYFVNISLSTYSKLEGKQAYKILIHEVLREDSHQLFGFADEEERDIFRHLISVTGVGSSTARVMLSSLSPSEVRNAILSSDVNVLKGIKGIGLKTGQRIIVDLADKIDKQRYSGEIFSLKNNTNREEALSALVMLGFAKNAVIKVLDKIEKEERGLSVENLIKRALKNL